MTAEQLFESVGSLDDDLLERSEQVGRGKWHIKLWFSLAACLCLLVVAGVVFSSRAQGKFIYNDAQMYDILVDEPYGRYYEELDEAERRAVLPNNMPEWMSCASRAKFEQDGQLVNVDLQVATTNPELDVVVTIGGEILNPLGYWDLTIPQTTRCGDVEFTLYRYQYDTPIEDRFMLTATAQINEIDLLFEVYGNLDLETQAKADFEQILLTFASYEKRKPDLSVITSGSEPVWYTKDLTIEQAKVDPDFGGFLPSTLMEEAKLVELYRVKDRYMDSLQSVWEMGDGFTSWNISYYDPEKYADFFVSVDEREKYDRSYDPANSKLVETPFFLAEEITLETVQVLGYQSSEDRYVLDFFIVYGDIRVHIYAVNIEPEWIFWQIQNMLMEQTAA